MKKIKPASFILIILTMCFIFTACSQNDNTVINENNNNQNNQSTPDIPNESREETTEPPAISRFDTLGERSFNGATFTILDAPHHLHLQSNMPEEEGLTGDPINDALFNRDKLIEEKYDVNIEYIQLPGFGTGNTNLQRSVLAGEQLYDLVVSPVLGNSLNTNAMNNILYNLIDAPHLSLGSPW